MGLMGAMLVDFVMAQVTMCTSQMDKMHSASYWRGQDVGVGGLGRLLASFS